MEKPSAGINATYVTGQSENLSLDSVNNLLFGYRYLVEKVYLINLTRVSSIFTKSEILPNENMCTRFENDASFVSFHIIERFERRFSSQQGGVKMTLIEISSRIITVKCNSFD